MSELKMVTEMVGPDTAPMGEMRLVFFTGGGTTEENLRRMDREDRADLRRWFEGSPHYSDFIALIDRINAEESESR
jgi:hypothetical protein